MENQSNVVDNGKGTKKVVNRVWSEVVDVATKQVVGIKVEFKDIQRDRVFGFKELPSFGDMVATPFLFNFFVHGVKQKLADTVANSNKKGWNSTQQLEVIESYWSLYVAGEWAKRKKAEAKIVVSEKLQMAMDKLEAGEITQSEYDMFAMLLNG